MNQESTDSKFHLLKSIDLACEKCKFSKALAKCNRALRLFDGDPELLRRKGMIVNVLGDDEGALRIFSDLIKADPKTAENYYGPGVVYYFGKKFGQAQEYLEKAVSLSPSFMQANSLLVETYVQLEMLNEAEKLISTQLSRYRHGTEKNVLRAMLLCSRAEIELKRNQVNMARQSLLQATALDKNNPRVLSTLRRLNPAMSSASKCYIITVEGDVATGLFSRSAVTYFGNFEVIADSKDEALGYIREMESIAKPETLRIAASKSKHVKDINQQKGVTYVFPSYSIETAELGSMANNKILPPNVFSTSMPH